jgi:alkylation response protein AidB-like acyl-CoA dehydrogenase
MFDFMLTDEQRALRDEVRAFAREKVPRQLILDMDADRVRYPREYVEKLAAHRLLGLRFSPEYGGRGLGWQEEIVALEEVGVLGTSLTCLFSLPSIVGEALHVFGTPEQKARWLRPALAGQLTVAEALTEPRGGSDFFGTTTRATRDGDGFRLKGQKRFVVGAEGADFLLVYARTDPDAPPHKGISAFIVERGEGVEVHHVYGLMGTRGGGTGRLYFRDAYSPRASPGWTQRGGWSMPRHGQLTAGSRRRAGCGVWSRRVKSSPPRPPGRWSTMPCRSWAASVTPTSTPSSGCCATCGSSPSGPARTRS